MPQDEDVDGTIRYVFDGRPEYTENLEGVGLVGHLMDVMAGPLFTALVLSFDVDEDEYSLYYFGSAPMGTIAARIMLKSGCVIRKDDEDFLEISKDDEEGAADYLGRRVLEIYEPATDDIGHTRKLPAFAVKRNSGDNYLVVSRNSDGNWEEVDMTIEKAA